MLMPQYAMSRPQRLQFDPKRYNQALQVVHGLHRQNGAGELGNCFVNLFSGRLGHWSRPARMNPEPLNAALTFGAIRLALGLLCLFSFDSDY